MSLHLYMFTRPGRVCLSCCVFLRLRLRATPLERHGRFLAQGFSVRRRFAVAMGTSTSEHVAPFPERWGASDERLDALRRISETPAETFLSVAAGRAELEADAWQLDAFSGHAVECQKLDPALCKLLYRMVPRRVTESEFWRLYFCHVSNALGSTFTKALLEAGDDSCSNAIIRAFQEDSTFQEFARKETNGIVQRDAEDDEKLAVGISKAVAKGVIPAQPPVEPVCRIDVKGKSADAVAQEIIEKLGEAPQTGCVLVLQGLSGTGKGTTVAKLQAKLPRAVCWSNGNVFRSLTLLAVSHCERQGVPFTPESLTPELLQELMAQLQFGKFNGKFDTHIASVAEITQGEIIKFAGNAADQMSADGMNVLMEGRAQTLDYVRTPHRFELVLSEPGIIGMRRAAQRMSASALKSLSSDASHDEVQEALAKALAEMACVS